MSSGFLPICQNQIQGLFKEFQGPYKGYIRRIKLNQTGTFISIYKRHKLPQRGPRQSPGQEWILCTSEVRMKPSGTPFLFLFLLSLRTFAFKTTMTLTLTLTFFSINWFGHSVLENQIQALSRTFRQRFKDFQGPRLFSRTFQALKIWKKNSRTFKDPQEPCTLNHSQAIASGRSSVRCFCL